MRIPQLCRTEFIIILVDLFVPKSLLLSRGLGVMPWSMLRHVAGRQNFLHIGAVSRFCSQMRETFASLESESGTWLQCRSKR